MSKNMLIAGKDFPEVVELAESAALAGFGLSIAASPAENTGLSTKEIAVIPWNKGSSVSARSVVIQAETRTGTIDNYVLYFDSADFSQKFGSFRPDTCGVASDSMILGYQYLTMEILTRIQQHGTPARIIYVLKTNPSEKDAALSPALRNSGITLANPIVAAAEAAFATFAENAAAVAADRENVSVLLVTGDEQNETIKKDSQFASWLSSYIEASDQLKHKPGAKAAVNWVKAGAKAPGGFSLFK